MKGKMDYLQICYVRDNYLEMSQKKMAAHLKVPVIWIRDLMKRSGWIVTKKDVYRKRGKVLSQITSSDPDTDDYLEANYLLVPVKRMAANLGRSHTFVSTRLRQLNLIIPREIIEQRKKNSQIKPGATPPNKGKKMEEFMDPESITKFRANQYQKGRLPHNTSQEDGEIRIRNGHKNRKSGAYKYLRLSLGKWVQLHRHNWEKKNGPVPKGMCLWAKDDDSLNCDPDNWELITRKENMRRNNGSKDLKDGYILGILAPRQPELKDHIREQYPDLIELKRNELEANRIIRKHGQR